MERINTFGFYEIGKTFQNLLSRSPPVDANEVFYDLIMARTSLAGLLAGKPVAISFSKARAAHFQSTLVRCIEATSVQKKAAEEAGDEAPRFRSGMIPEWEWGMLKSAITDLETVLNDEMKEAATYSVPRRGIYSTPALVDSAHETFPTDIRDCIPEKTILDWKASGRCLAFSLLTASGFHAARAVEGMLEAYYQTLSGKPVTHFEAGMII